MKHLAKLLLASLASRKLWMTVFSLFINYGVYWGAVRCIYTFSEPAQLQVFLALTQAMLWTNSTILLAYLGIQGVTSWNNSTASVLSSIVNHSTEKRTEDITERLFRVEKLDPKDIDEEAFPK